MRPDRRAAAGLTVRAVLTMALVAGGVAFAAPATAVECRLGFEYQYVTTVAGRDVYACLPDNGPCPEDCPPPVDPVRE